MPYRKFNVRRRALSALGQLQPEEVEYLFTGYVMIPCRPENMHPFPNQEAVREVWEANRERLLKWWIGGIPRHLLPAMTMLVKKDFVAARPGTRPWAWWRFEGESIRRRLLRVQETRPRPGTEYLDFTWRDPLPGEEEAAWASNARLYAEWGKNLGKSEVFGGLPACRGTAFEEWEGETECLKRAGVLTPEELSLLA